MCIRDRAKRPPAPITITDPAVVGRLAALVDSLPVSPLNNEAVSCPAAFGIGLQLAFRTRTGGPVVALVQTDQPCGMVDFTVTGQRLLGLENNINVDRQVLAIASLPWKLPNPLRAPERPDRCWAGSPAIEPAADKADIARRPRPATITQRDRTSKA